GPLRTQQIVAAINIDGASIVPFDAIDVGCAPPLCAHAADAGRQLGIQTNPGALAASGSDHAPFAKAGVPSIWIQAALPPGWMDRYYHTPKDDVLQPIDFDAMARYARITYLVASSEAS